MSDQKHEYAPGTYARSKQFADGGEIIKVSIQVEKFVDWLTSRADEKGYARLEIVKRREPKDDITHSVRLDAWKPTKRHDDASPDPSPEAQKVAQQARAALEDDDKLPF